MMSLQEKQRRLETNQSMPFLPPGNLPSAQGPFHDTAEVNYHTQSKYDGLAPK